MWYDRVQRHMIFKVGKMAKNVEEWIENEKENNVLGVSLRPENYKLPMIRLTFGDQILNLPQNKMTIHMADFGYGNLKHNLVLANKDALKEKGFDLRFQPLNTGADWEKAYVAMGEVLKDVGPYEVCKNAYLKAWVVEMDGYASVEEEACNFDLGEKQDW